MQNPPYNAAPLPGTSDNVFVICPAVSDSAVTIFIILPTNKDFNDAAFSNAKFSTMGNVKELILSPTTLFLSKSYSNLGNGAPNDLFLDKALKSSPVKERFKSNFEFIYSIIYFYKLIY